MKKQLALLFLLLTFTFCTQKPQTEASQIPFDEIPMEYSKGNFYMPILDGIVNDSLPFKVFFDTGLSGKSFAVSDSMKNNFIGDSALIQIGKSKMLMGIRYVGSNQVNVFQLLGKNSIVIGWEFFDGKIIEFSFDSLYIRVYDSLPDLTGYSKTKIKLTPSSFLVVPVKAMLQGKTIEDTLIFDTGYNGYVSFRSDFVEKYGINTADAYHGHTSTHTGVVPAFSLPADTIKIGDAYTANEDLRVAFWSQAFRKWASSLLGTQTLDDFSVVLDLINYDLYLKKLE